MMDIDLISMGARMRQFPASYSHPHQRHTVYLAQEVVLSHSVSQPRSCIKCERRTSSLGNMSQAVVLKTPAKVITSRLSRSFRNCFSHSVPVIKIEKASCYNRLLRLLNCSLSLLNVPCLVLSSSLGRFIPSFFLLSSFIVVFIASVLPKSTVFQCNKVNPS